MKQWNRGKKAEETKKWRGIDGGGLGGGVGCCWREIIGVQHNISLTRSQQPTKSAEKKRRAKVFPFVRVSFSLTKVADVEFIYPSLHVSTAIA